MDARMVKAGLAAALALTLLVPTFNALNASYVENVTPPPWMPPPEEPPNITPPTNFKPPPDMTPPTNWKGEIPPGACPPPVIETVPGTEQNLAVQSPATQDWVRTIAFELPEGAVALGGWVNFTNWQGRRVVTDLRGPEGFEGWRGEDVGDAVLLQSRAKTSPFEYNSTKGDNPRPPPSGNYTLSLRVEMPIGGTVQTKFLMALACGGMMSR